jgi:two-component system cell cycle sensor histidine kinase PleC
LSRFESLLSAKAEIVGHAKILAAPAYEKLLRSERPLRRSIPVLIILFLAIAAVARLASLVSERYTIENDVARDLKIAATLMRAESQFALMSEGRVDGAAIFRSRRC